MITKKPRATVLYNLTPRRDSAAFGYILKMNDY